MNFPAVIHKDKTSDYGVTIPDLPGCFSAGRTIDEAIENAKEAILLHIEGLLDDNEKVPDASPIEDIQKHNRNAIIALVTVALSELFGKTKRINISVPSRVLTRVDRFVRTRGETRSGLIVNALLDYINHH